MTTIDEIKRQTQELAEAERIQYQGNGHEPEDHLESEPIPSTPELPESAWHGLFADYRDLVGPATEACDPFHFGVFLIVIGCLIGRLLHVRHAGKHYPNFFIALVGRSSLSRKDTAMGLGEELIDRVISVDPDEEKPSFRTVRGVRSAEGLLAEFEGKDKRRLVMLGELYSLMAKARQDATGNLIPNLTEMYDCKEVINPPSLGRKIVAIRPFLSVLAGSTITWLEKSLRDEEILSGFANRWMYITGTSKPPKPIPPPIDSVRLNSMVQSLGAIRNWAESVPNGEVVVSAEAHAMFSEYYLGYFRRCEAEGLIPTLIGRTQIHLYKIALCYAAVDCSPEIKPEHMEPAIEVAHYLEKAVADVFRNFHGSRNRKDEERILSFIQANPGEKTIRDIYKDLNIKDSKYCTNLVKGLVDIGHIKPEWKKSKRGPGKNVYYPL